MQLRMIRTNLLNLPEIKMPPGYRLRTYQENDNWHWANIINSSFGGDRTDADTREQIVDRPEFEPTGLFFSTYQDQPVGTACAWKWNGADEKEVGQLHMVGVMPEHSGYRLGKWVSLAVLHYHRQQGFKCAVLGTDDFRLPAIKTYLNLDFMPIYVDDDQPERWQVIFEKLKLPFISDSVDQVRTALSENIITKIYQ